MHSLSLSFFVFVPSVCPNFCENSNCGGLLFIGCAASCAFSCAHSSFKLLISTLISVPLIVPLVVSTSLYSSYFHNVMILMPCVHSEVIMPSFRRCSKKERTFFSDHCQRFAKNLMDAGYCPDVWKLKRNADILWAMTKSAKNCTTNRIISAKSLDIKSG